MAMTKTEFFNKLTSGAKWDVGVSIARGNPLPLDANSVFASKEAAETYIAGVLAYPGQYITVVGENETIAYVIVTDAAGKLSLRELATQTATGDVVNDVLALSNKVGTLEADMTNVKTDITEHDTAIEVLEGRVDILREDVDDIKADMVKVFSYQGSKDTYSDLISTDDDYEPVLGHVWNIKTAGGSDANGNAIKAGDNVVYNGTGWDVLAGIVDLSAYATTSAVNSAITTAKNEAAADATTKANAAQTAAEATAAAALSPVSQKANANAEAIVDLQEKDEELATAIDGKVSNSAFTEYQSSVSTALGKKTDKTYVDDQLALKANAADVSSSLEDKVDVTTHNADKKALEDAIALKADSATVTNLESNLTTEINKKANITDVNKKADMVTNAVNGNFAGLDASGNLTDSGKNAGSFDVAGAAAAVLGKADDAQGAATVHGALNKITAVNSTVQGHTSAIATLETTVAGKADSTTVNALTTTVNGHTSTIAEHTTAISGLEGSVQGLQKNKADATTVSGLESEVNTLKTTVADNKTAAEQALNKAIEDLNMTQYQTKATAKSEHDALEASINEAKGAAQTAQSAADANTAAIAEINNETNGILAQAKAHANDLDDAMDERVSALEQLTTGGTGSIADQIASAVDAEKTARESADTALDNKIAKNATDITNMDTAYKAADASLGERIDDVVSDLSDEVDAREKLDEDLRKLIADETSRAQTAENGLDAQIKAVDAALKLAVENNTEGMDSIKELATWVAEHGSEASEMVADISANTEAIAQEIADRKAAITGVNSSISTANGKITNLEGRMDTAEEEIDALQTAAAAVEGQISTAVNAEKVRAEAAEKKLTDDLQAEVTTRTNAVNAINTNIGTVPEGKNLVGMISEAQNAAITDANGKINSLAARVKVIEDDYLTEADKTALQGLITAEASARESGDANTLQAAKNYTDSKLTWNSWNT